MPASAGLRCASSFGARAARQQAASIHDRRLAQTVKRTQELPGDILFQYLDADGEPEPITSGDVNDYLRDVTGREFTAKDFRTWGGTLVATRELAGSGPTPRGKREQASRVSKALDSAAAHLGNTRAVARRSYVHPDVIASFLDGTLHEAWARGSAEALLPRTRNMAP